MNQNWEVTHSEEYGRNMQASTEILASQLICKEEPLIAVVQDSCLMTHCSTCFSTNTTMRQCSKCRFLVYCSRNCQERDWNIHQFECAAFRAASPNKPSTIIRAISRIYWSGISLELLFKNLITNTDKYSLERKMVFAHIITAVKSMVGSRLSSAKKAMDLLCLFSCNSMSICDGEMVNIGAALFVKVCWANHACAPNAFIVFNGSVASMRACKVIHPGEQILVSYTDSVTARRLRKSELLESYFFNCKCKLCTRIDDPLEMIFCQSCGVAGVPGVCSVCKSVMQLKDIDSSDISSIDTYKKCALKLAKTHWKLFKCRDRLIQSLLKSRDYLATIDMMQLQMDAYKSIFGPIYPMVTVNQLTIFKARLHLERFPDGGQECLAAFAKTHGSDHPLYIEALDNFRMLLHDADANNRAHTGEAGTGCDSCIY